MSFDKRLSRAFIVSMVTGSIFLVIGVYYSSSLPYQWRPLGKPPEEITKIVGTTMHSVTVETVSKTLYTYEKFPQENWMETTEIPAEELSEYIQCASLEPTDGIIDIRESCDIDPGGSVESVYALRKDGNVYLWSGRGYGKTVLDLLDWTELFWVPLLYFLPGAFFGFIGAWIYFLFSWLESFA